MDGGECPVSKDTVVDVKFKNGECFNNNRADNWNWKSRIHGWDIVAYRLSKPQHRTLEESYEDADRPISDGYVDSALNEQVSGTHYKQFEIQPIEFINANNLDFLAGNVVKYISRHKLKGGADDVKKAIHYCKLILELQYGEKE